VAYHALKGGIIHLTGRRAVCPRRPFRRYFGGGRPMAGFLSKNPSGFGWNPSEQTGMTGQSSGRGTWLWAKTYQTTRSLDAH
jgi:hypothetical protein